MRFEPKRSFLDSPRERRCSCAVDFWHIVVKPRRRKTTRTYYRFWKVALEQRTAMHRVWVASFADIYQPGARSAGSRSDSLGNISCARALRAGCKRAAKKKKCTRATARVHFFFFAARLQPARSARAQDMLPSESERDPADRARSLRITSNFLRCTMYLASHSVLCHCLVKQHSRKEKKKKRLSDVSEPQS